MQNSVDLKEKSQNLEKTSNEKFEYFCNLPKELQHYILNFLDLKDLSTMSIVSKTYRNFIANNFLFSANFINSFVDNLLNLDFKKKSHVLKTEDFGLFIKRSTFIFTNIDRIKIILFVFEATQLKEYIEFFYFNNSKNFDIVIDILKTIIGIVITGWTFEEKLKLFDEIESYLNLANLIKEFLLDNFDTTKPLEEYIRFIYRKIFFENFENNSKRAKWLILFLKKQTSFTEDIFQQTTYQSKVIILFFAPLSDDKENNLLYVDVNSFSNCIYIKRGLEYLGFIIKILNQKIINDELDICKIIIALVNTDSFWLLENFSTLLFHSGFFVTKKVLDFFLEKNGYCFLISLLTYFFVIEGKIGDGKFINQIYDYLNKKLEENLFNNILESISLHFCRISEQTEISFEDRDYLEVPDITNGIRMFYELKIKKMFEHLKGSIKRINDDSNV